MVHQWYVKMIKMWHLILWHLIPSIDSPGREDEMNQCGFDYSALGSNMCESCESVFFSMSTNTCVHTTWATCHHMLAAFLHVAHGYNEWYPQKQTKTWKRQKIWKPFTSNRLKVKKRKSFDWLMHLQRCALKRGSTWNAAFLHVDS